MTRWNSFVLVPNLSEARFIYLPTPLGSLIAATCSAHPRAVAKGAGRAWWDAVGERSGQRRLSPLRVDQGWGQLRSWSWSWVQLQLQLQSWSWNWSWNLWSWSWNFVNFSFIYVLFETYDFENWVHHIMPNNKTVCLTVITFSEVLKYKDHDFFDFV